MSALYSSIMPSDVSIVAPALWKISGSGIGWVSGCMNVPIGRL